MKKIKLKKGVLKKYGFAVGGDMSESMAIAVNAKGDPLTFKELSKTGYFRTMVFSYDDEDREFLTVDHSSPISMEQYKAYEKLFDSVDEEVDNLKTVQIDYVNSKDKRGLRTVQPKLIYIGSTEFHKEEQWLLLAFDLDIKADREFALKDIKEWIPTHEYVRQQLEAQRILDEVIKNTPKIEVKGNFLDFLKENNVEITFEPLRDYTSLPSMIKYSKDLEQRIRGLEKRIEEINEKK